MLIYDRRSPRATALASWAEAHLRPGISVVPGDSIDDAELARLALCRADVDSATYWIDGNGRTWRGPLALARLLQAIGGAWTLPGHALAHAPLRWLASPIEPLLVRAIARGAAPTG